MKVFIRQEIISGLQLLYTLRLPGAPPAEALTATAQGWMTALSERTAAWDEQLDASRINKAFATLAAEATRWPPPAALIERIPQRPAVKKLEHNKRQTPEQKAHGKANLQRIQTLINQVLTRKGI
ncbi:hypothetical protein [Snodgrassella sp. CFCC 13594]|uniref:hypothetical protein n=1 Tax=Snodgrassella sp. CFCC 13594 TaxID=1775559 RepID=UPI0008376F38|nr:hypothetical protein [Snodgrassella sp. CFCC 13594]